MKKISLMLLLVIMGLTGCENKTDYEKLVSSISGDGVAEAYIYKTSIEPNPDSSISTLGVSTEYSAALNMDGSLLNMVQSDYNVYYADDGYTYANMNNADQWYKHEYSGGLDPVMESLPTSFPKGEEIITDNPTGIEIIDSTLEGKKLNDVVVSNGKNQYSLAGLEEQLVIEGQEQLKLTLETEYFTWEILIAPTPYMTLPVEAADAIDTRD